MKDLRELVRLGRGDTLPDGSPLPEEPEGSAGIYLYDPEKNSGVWLTHYVSDAREDLTDEDFNFDAKQGRAWSDALLDDED